MGLGYHMVEALVRENLYKRIAGEVVLIGRQTIYFEADDILSLLREHGHTTSGIDAASIELDTKTAGRRAPYDRSHLISDTALFRLLGVESIKALDLSAYEGAEIIHDLTKQLPEALHGIADFVVDGSTLDNTFDPAMTLRNLAELLKPGGRILGINQYSNHHNPYVLPHPLWYLDYFVVNKFKDCKVYVLAFEFIDSSNTSKVPTNVFTINPEYLLDRNRSVSTFVSAREMMIVYLAEKDENSTTNMYPSQQHYRSEAEWSTYRRNLSVIAASGRPHVVRSIGPMTLEEVRGGHLFISEAFSEEDPATAYREASLHRQAGQA